MKICLSSKNARFSGSRMWANTPRITVLSSPLLIFDFYLTIYFSNLLFFKTISYQSFFSISLCIYLFLNIYSSFWIFFPLSVYSIFFQYLKTISSVGISYRFAMTAAKESYVPLEQVSEPKMFFSSCSLIRHSYQFSCYAWRRQKAALKEVQKEARREEAGLRRKYILCN